MPPLREIDPKAEQKTGRIKIKSSTPGKSTGWKASWQPRKKRQYEQKKFKKKYKQMRKKIAMLREGA